MNFPLILFVLVVFTGILWVIDKLYWSKQRRAAAQAAVNDFDQATQRRFRVLMLQSCRSARPCMPAP